MLLAAWEPLTLALTASRLLPSLAYGAPAAALALAVRAVVMGVGVAAALALWKLHAVGVTLAKLFLILSTVLGVLTATTSIFPSSLAPSARLPALVLFVSYNAAWYAYLLRSKRVRRTYG